MMLKNLFNNKIISNKLIIKMLLIIFLFKPNIKINNNKIIKIIFQIVNKNKNFINRSIIIVNNKININQIMNIS